MLLPLFFFSEDKPTPRSATPSTSAHPHERGARLLPSLCGRP